MLVMPIVLTRMYSSVENTKYNNKELMNVFNVSRAFSTDNGTVATPEPIEHSASPTKLLHELKRVKEDLKNKDIEIQRAHEIRENTDREIEDLTASLFEVYLLRNEIYSNISVRFLSV